MLADQPDEQHEPQVDPDIDAEFQEALAAASRKRGRGQPTKFTPELGRSICQWIREGNYLEAAAAGHGLDPDLVWHWIRLGNAGREPWATFSREYTLANGEIERKCVERWLAHADNRNVGDWRGFAHFLGLRFKGRWAQLREAIATGMPDQPKRDKRPLSEVLAEIRKVAEEQEAKQAERAKTIPFTNGEKQEKTA